MMFYFLFVFLFEGVVVVSCGVGWVGFIALGGSRFLNGHMGVL